jgi:arginase
LDPGEYNLIKELNLHVYTTKRIKEYGMDHVVNEMLRDIQASNINAVHFSFDIDFVDADLVPGTGTPVKDGINIEDTKLALEKIAQSKLVKSMDFVELNPLLDRNDITADLSIELLDWIFEHLKN